MTKTTQGEIQLECLQSETSLEDTQEESLAQCHFNWEKRMGVTEFTDAVNQCCWLRLNVDSDVHAGCFI